MSVERKRVSLEDLKRIEDEICILLHASRDALRTRGKDTTQMTFDVNDAYYAEAYGLIRALRLLGMASQDRNVVASLWDERGYLNSEVFFGLAQDRVLEEEGFRRENRCAHCRAAYGRDQPSAAWVPFE